MLVKKTTEQMVRESEARSYNESIWVEAIGRMGSMSPEYFESVGKAGKFFVKYTTPDGINLFKEFYPFISSLTSGGFFRVDMRPILEDGRTHEDFIDMHYKAMEKEAKELIGMLESTDLFEVSLGKFFAPDGSEHMIGTTPQAREVMKEKSKYGVVFSKGLS